jgi:hypothetical protein
MKRVYEIGSWLCGSVSIVATLAGLLLANSPAHAQVPGPDPGCTSCVGTTIADANGNILGNTHCSNCTIVMGQCRVTINGTSYAGECITPLYDPQNCQSCHCGIKTTSSGSFCRCTH